VNRSTYFGGVSCAGIDSSLKSVRKLVGEAQVKLEDDLRLTQLN
jgi:hypothetical protein